MLLSTPARQEIQNTGSTDRVNGFVTREIPPISYDPPRSVEQLYEGGPSPAGWSTVSEYLTCPERARLRAMGVRPLASFKDDGSLDALGFGLLMHALRAYRIVAGHQAAEELLAQFEGLTNPDRLKALGLLRVYDLTYPLHLEPWEYIGVEAEVRTEIAPGIIRTVRYDAVVRPWKRIEHPDGRVELERSSEVLSLELKTSSRGGQSAMTAYFGQFCGQVAIWNANPYLVEKYGRCAGVVPDVMVKTTAPQAERIGPLYFEELSQRRVLEYLQLADQLRFPVAADGSWPRMIHSCWSKFGPCPYIDLCHHDSRGSYEWPEQPNA